MRGDVKQTCNVDYNQERAVEPMDAATVSRIGRSTNQLESAKKKNANDAIRAATSSGRTSTARRSGTKRK